MWKKLWKYGLYDAVVAKFNMSVSAHVINNHAIDDIVSMAMMFLQHRRKKRRSRNMWVLWLFDTAGRLRGVPRFRTRAFWYESQVDWDDAEFRKNMRMSRESLSHLCDVIDIDSSYKYRSEMNIPTDMCVAIFVWRAGSMMSCREIATHFGVSESSVIRCTQRCVRALVACADRYVMWPTHAQLHQASARFKERAGMPHCVGAIDGTHIPIVDIAIDVNEAESYRCRKMFQSIVVQGVVDARKRFIHALVGSPGSYNDARVYSLSGLETELEALPAGINNTHDCLHYVVYEVTLTCCLL